MNRIRMASFSVIGTELRTSNAREMTGQGVIGQLWSKVKPDLGPPVAVYSDYESDKDGEYNYMLGIKATGNDSPSPGFSRRTIEAGDYVCLKSEGPIAPDVVVGLWRRIWDLEQTGELARAYRTDFEIYTANGMELYVGVKR